jgi:membrane protein required for colicin V production
MPITLLDIILLLVMLISGLLAMIRGFMRVSVAAVCCITAQLLTITISFSALLPIAKQYFANDYIATGAVLTVIGVIFFVTLLAILVIAARLSHKILDHRIGPLDRMLGCILGLARGLLIVVATYTAFVWLVPANAHPDWIRDAKSSVILRETGQWLMSANFQALDNLSFAQFSFSILGGVLFAITIDFWAVYIRLAGYGPLQLGSLQLGSRGGLVTADGLTDRMFERRSEPESDQ